MSPDVLELRPGQLLEIDGRIELAEHDVRFLDARDAPLARHDVVVITGTPSHEIAADRKTDDRGILRLKLPLGPVTFRDALTRASASLDWGRDAANPVDVRFRARD